jgi:hypothetical protein
MNPDDERIEYAISHTEVLRSPKQTLSTFGTTNIYYYLVTEPSYGELVKGEDETVVREGRVLAERPRVVTPSYLVNVEGFSEHARRYLEMLIHEHGPHAPGLFYGYRNEPKEMNIVSSDIASVVSRLEEEIDKGGNPLSTIIKGVDELWDVSLLKFIYDMTRYSLGSNVFELGRRGLLDVDPSGVPLDARRSIEHLFHLVNKGELEPSALKMELDRWNLFDEYEDRFFRLFGR